MCPPSALRSAVPLTPLHEGASPGPRERRSAHISGGPLDPPSKPRKVTEGFFDHTRIGLRVATSEIAINDTHKRRCNTLVVIRRQKFRAAHAHCKHTSSMLSKAYTIPSLQDRGHHNREMCIHTGYIYHTHHVDANTLLRTQVKKCRGAIESESVSAMKVR